ncbi:hypothetical protein BO78DRAFT_74039 [Aspergillus sclerotiicarbonarius CBS 121057]|uniref:Uncharacterized protein n=1 Tax=Aspergillus sclerotiicarbonarius (strain CBS 121057 / IBT 28362) TaxID=1448318 RepID=A0A319EG36_ASPSB|nr:hypothetical protein BO78DRAFT_74039 [Aspergillus sclerotiicarbonarius CBS 121057]
MSERDTESTDHGNQDMLASASPMVGSVYLQRRGSGETLLTFPSEEPITPGSEAQGSTYRWLQVLSDEESTALSPNLMAFYDAFHAQQQEPPEPQSQRQDCLGSLPGMTTPSIAPGSSNSFNATGQAGNLSSPEMLLPSRGDLELMPSIPRPPSPCDDGFNPPSTYVDNTNLSPDQDTGGLSDELTHAIVTLQRQKDQLCTHAKQRLEATLSLYDFGVLFGILSPRSDFRQLLKDAHLEFCTLQNALTPPPCEDSSSSMDRP